MKMQFKKSAGKEKVITDGCWDILVVDDDKSVHELTRILLGDFLFLEKNVKLHSAYNIEDAKSIIKGNESVSIILLDVVMEEEDSGLKFVDYVRSDLKNDLVQIILRTGQPGKAPSDTVLEKYDIDIYLEKSDQQNNLFLNLIKSSLSNYERKIIKRELEKILIKAKEDAEATARNRMAFLAYITHEIRNPLGQFVQGIDVLARTQLDERQSECVKIVQAGGEQLLDLCNDLLDHEKLSIGQMKIEDLEFNLKDLLQEIIKVAELGRSEQDKEQLKITSQIDPSLPQMVVSDRMRLRQVINNLMSNAKKFTQAGYIELGAEVESTETQAIHLLFWIKDTGIGLPEDKLKSIFDPYVQAEDSTARMYKGTGLGLSICKQFVELMQGSIWVTNNPEGGSCFKFRVVMRKAA